jgi:uncharacterized protein (DUF885 family)
VTPPTNDAPHRPVDEICDAYVDAAAEADPVAATVLGIPGYEDRLPDLSPDGYAHREQLVRDAITAAEAATPVDERESIARAAFLERLGLELETYTARIPQTQVSTVNSELHSLRSCFDLMATDTEDAWTDIDRRLAAIPAAVSDYQRTLLDGADAGYVSARVQFEKVATQLDRWTNRAGDGNNVFLDLVGRSTAGEQLRGRLERHAEGASRAFADMSTFLREQLAPRGRDKEAVGRDEYSLCSRSFLGAVVDLDETYAWGWAELHALDTAMDQVSRQIVPGGSVDDAVKALDVDPARMISGKERFRDWMQGLAERAIADLTDVHFDIPEPVRAIECCLAPTGDGGIYYTGPSEDFSRPGRMWWDVPHGISEFSTWREVTTVYHEGAPGHHLQVAQTIYRRDTLNRWQRLMCWVSGHGEGWALYAERLMDDLGYLSDPGDKLGMLASQAFRAARVIVDIGMHLELEIPADNPFGFHPGERWTPELGYEFIRQHSLLEEAVVRYEVDRYLGWPGQAPSYKVGERIWLQARDDAMARHGADFDLKSFHRQALDLGSMGLDPFRRVLGRP